MHTPDDVTPPAPGLEREEPELAGEDDIPTDTPPAQMPQTERGTG